eukprot:3676452-Pyramimonas_sp.AAC.1
MLIAVHRQLNTCSHLRENLAFGKETYRDQPNLIPFSTIVTLAGTSCALRQGQTRVSSPRAKLVKLYVQHIANNEGGDAIEPRITAGTRYLYNWQNRAEGTHAATLMKSEILPTPATYSTAAQHRGFANCQRVQRCA